MSHLTSRSHFGLQLSLLVLLCGAGGVRAASYVGLGGGVTPLYSTRLITQYSAGPESLSLRRGYGFEAQFGWETAPWIDFEGALRYHLFSRGDSASYVRTTPTGHDVIGFEGGIRLHPRRRVTNTMPYIRLGLGSYSPSVTLNGGESTISGDPVLGYYVGVGYVYEMSSAWGLDLRASTVVYNAFNKNQTGIELHAMLIALTLSVIIF